MVANWRKSTLKTLLDGCSWQWALENVYKMEGHGSPQTALGTGFHKAMENYELGERRDSLENLQASAAECAFDECKLLPMDTWFEHELDPQWVVDNAMEAVRLWWEQPMTKTDVTLKDVADNRRFIEAEKHFRVDYDEATGRGLSGTIDAIYEEDDCYVLVDYKTASSFRKWTYEQGSTIEAAVYLYMASKYYDDKPIKFEWHVVSPKEQKVRLVEGGILDEPATELLASSVRTANTLYDRDAFRPRPDWNLCSPKWCAFYQGCRVDGTLSPYALTISNKPADQPAPARSEGAG